MKSIELQNIEENQTQFEHKRQKFLQNIKYQDSLENNAKIRIKL